MKRLPQPLSGALSEIVDTVLPPRCVLTGDMVDRQGMLSSKGWSGLDFIADPFCPSCGICFDFEVEQGGLKSSAFFIGTSGA